MCNLLFFFLVLQLFPPIRYTTGDYVLQVNIPFDNFDQLVKKKTIPPLGCQKISCLSRTSRVLMFNRNLYQVCSMRHKGHISFTQHTTQEEEGYYIEGSFDSHADNKHKLLCISYDTDLKRHSLKGGRHVIIIVILGGA